MLLLLLPLLGIELYSFVLESLPEMRRGIVLGERLEDVVDRTLPDVDEHVGVGEPLGRSSRVVVVVPRLVSSWGRKLSSVVVLENLLVGNRSDSVVVVLEPLSILLGLDESEIVTAVEISSVNEDSVKLVDVVVVSFSVLVEVGSEVELEGKLVSIVDLLRRKEKREGRRVELESARVFENVSSNDPSTRENERKTDLDHRISLHIVLEPLELKVQHWWERLEDDSLPRVLKSVALRLVLVLSVHRLDRDVILERVVEILHSLDVELDVCERGKARNGRSSALGDVEETRRKRREGGNEP